MKLLLEGGLVWTMERDFRPAIMNVLIDDGKIAAMGPDIADGDARGVDCAGKVVLPGLIDAHSHIGLFGTAMGERGVDGNENTSACKPELRGIDGLNPFDSEFGSAAAHGVTTVSTGPGSANPICGQFVTLKTFGPTLDARIVSAPSAMKMAFGENPKCAHGGAAPVTRMGTAAIIREALFKARRYADDKDAAEREGKPLPPFDIKLEALVPVVQGQLPVKAHAHRADDILTALRIAGEFGLDMTIEHASEGHLIPEQLGGAKGVIIGPLLGFPHKLELVNRSASAACVYYAHGVKFAIMSDLPATHSWEILTEAGLCVREGLPLIEGIRAITISAAELLKIDGRVGSIAPGKDADIAVFDQNPVECLQSRCWLTIVNGTVAHGAEEM